MRLMPLKATYTCYIGTSNQDVEAKTVEPLFAASSDSTLEREADV